MSTSANNWILIDMPLLMGRSVVIRNDNGELVPDPTWHEQVTALYRSLISFLISEGLIESSVRLPDEIARVILRENDLTEVGLEFWRTGVVSNWLGSFDRSPHKSVTNFKQMERALSKVRRQFGE